MLILLGVFVLLSGVAWWSLQHEQRNTMVEMGHAELLPGFTSQTDKLISLVLSDSAGDLVRVEKLEAGWQLYFPQEERYFPANADDIAALINALAKARIVELKTQVPANYARLGVEDITTADARSRLLTLSTTSQQWQLLVGQTASSGSGQFARVPGEAQSFLIDSTLSLPQARGEWLRPQVLEWETNELLEVVFAGAVDEISLRQDENNGWQLVSLADDEQLRYPNILSQTVRALLRFRFYDVELFQATDWENSQIEASVTLQYTQGETVQALLYATPAGEQYRLHLNSSEADRWFNDWVFHLDAFSAKALLVTRDSLVERVEDTKALNEVVETTND